MATAPQEFPIQLGKYRLLRKLARGGMAELFLATRPGSSQPLVIKRVLPHFCSDPEFLTMFLNEARIASQLKHPNIVGVYDLGQEGEQIYIAMEYIDGSDLEHLCKESGGTIAPNLAARIGAAICDALYYANRVTDVSTGRPLNVIHRDVTPGNVMITRQGVVKLVDFGVAKATAQLERTRPGVVKGKFRYMSPEQIQLKELDGRSDLFSLGVLLYEVTTGSKPFDRPQVIEIIRALSDCDPPPPSELVAGYPRALSDVIMKALCKDPDQRYRDAQEMMLALERALTEKPTGLQDLAAFVGRLLGPPIELPPEAREHADGKTDPSAFQPRLDDADEVSTSEMSNEGIRRPTSQHERRPAPRMTSSSIARQAGSRPATSASIAARRQTPPAAAEPPSPFDDDERTTLAPGPFAGAGKEPPRLHPTPPGPRSRQTRATRSTPRPQPPAPAARDDYGQLGDEGDEGQITVTSRDKNPPGARQARLLRLLVLVFVLLCAAILVGLFLRAKQIPATATTLETSAAAATGSAAAPDGAGAGDDTGLAGDEPPAPINGPKGTLRIEGTAGIRAVVDGKLRCTVPCSLELAAGQHAVVRMGGKKALLLDVADGGTSAILLK
jgi:serine/threonine-protein kinase